MNGPSRRGRSIAIGLGIGGGLVGAVACAPIVGRPLSNAPMNACPAVACDMYITGARTGAQCTDGRCLVPTGLPTSARVLVDVPDTSPYAPARTFVLTPDDLTSSPTIVGPCRPPTCAQLPVLVIGEGAYRVTAKAATDVAYPQVLPEGTSIPVRVEFRRLEGAAPAIAGGLPFETSFVSSQIVRRPGIPGPLVLYTSAVSLGSYERIAYPQPPYDSYFPPLRDVIPVAEAFIDEPTVGRGAYVLDDETGVARTATITRDEGLDGFSTWLVDRRSELRLSPKKTLTSVRAQSIRLDTIGQNESTSSSAIREGVDIVIAPNAGAIALPTMRTAVLIAGGTDLGSYPYPSLPAPASVSGVVAVGGGDALGGVPSQITFRSQAIRQTDGVLRDYLHYETTVSSDAAGYFATVLPPGNYVAIVAPVEGTGYAKGLPEEGAVNIVGSRTDLRFTPRPRTKVTGRVILADGRPLADAELRALPTPAQSPSNLGNQRPARARIADDGTYGLELDPGAYDFVVDPAFGTGFPRVVNPRVLVASNDTTVEMVVPPPSRFAFTFRDPNATRIGNPIVRATVRVFVPPAGEVDRLVEIGRGMTDEFGFSEILLAQQPR